MRPPRLPRPALPILAALLTMWALRRTLRSLGESLVPLLRRSAAASGLDPLLSLIPALLVFALAAWLWKQSARDRRARALFAAVLLGTLTLSYLTSGEVSTRGDFHGLLTPEPGSTSIERSTSRPQVHYAINAHGFRKPEFALQKPPGTLRIALIGGSFVFGAGVEQDQTLDAALTTQLHEALPARPLEVLNLGLAGDALPSHLALTRIAQEHLDVDLTVLCLLLPAELSARDGQRERRSAFQLDAFSLVSWSLGMQAARFLWDPGDDQRTFTPERLTLLRSELDTLRAFRAAHGERPLLVLGYEDLPEEAAALFRALPAVTVLPALPRRDDHFFPGDGHPTAAGNRAFAAQLTPAILALPGWAR